MKNAIRSEVRKVLSTRSVWGLLLLGLVVEIVSSVQTTDPSLVEKGEAAIRRFGGVLDGWLSGHRFLCGDRLSVADFSAAIAHLRRKG